MTMAAASGVRAVINAGDRSKSYEGMTNSMQRNGNRVLVPAQALEPSAHGLIMADRRVSGRAGVRRASDRGDRPG